MLRASLSRSRIQDPIVNGYTRRTRGLLAYMPYAPSLKVGPGVNKSKLLGVASFAGVLQATCTQTSVPIPGRSLCGIQLGPALIYHGERGANGGPELWVSGAYTGFSVQDASTTQAYKLAIDATRVRAWTGGFSFADQTYAGAGRGTAYQYIQTDNNPDNEADANYSSVAAAIDNALHFARCPAGGFVVVTIDANAPVTVNLDGAGTGSLDLAAQRFPFALGLDIQDATHASRAQLAIRQASGGDEYGLQH